MSTPVNLPALGESVTEGTVTRWLKQVGDTVEVDEPLLEVSTDKVDTEIPSPVAGTLLEIKAEEDETVEVGAELCVIGDEGEAAVRRRRRLRRVRASAADAEPRRRRADRRRRGAGRRLRGSPPRRPRTSRSPRRRSRSSRPRSRHRRRRHLGDAARPGRVGHRGHRHPLAEVGRRRGRGRRAAARGLHRQGRHRDPLPRRRHAAGDQGRGGRDRRGRRRARRHR